MSADEARKKKKQEVQREDKWRRITMVALFLDDNKTNDDSMGRRTAKTNMLILTNNNFARAPRSTLLVHHAILYISLSSLHHYNMKLPNFTSRLYGVGQKTTQKLSLFFFNLDNDRYGPKENFAEICQIKWNWIRSMKFEIMLIDF